MLHWRTQKEGRECLRRAYREHSIQVVLKGASWQFNFAFSLQCSWLSLAFLIKMKRSPASQNKAWGCTGREFNEVVWVSNRWSAPKKVRVYIHLLQLYSVSPASAVSTPPILLSPSGQDEGVHALLPRFLHCLCSTRYEVPCSVLLWRLTPPLTVEDSNAGGSAALCAVSVLPSTLTSILFAIGRPHANPLLLLLHGMGKNISLWSGAALKHRRMII